MRWLHARVLIAALLTTAMTAGCTTAASGRWIDGNPAAGTATQRPPTSAPLIGIYDPRRDAEADLRDALVEAAATDRKVLVTFGAEWCAICKRLRRTLRSTALTGLLEKHYVVVTICIGNFDHNIALARKYVRLKSVPAALILDSAGKTVASSEDGSLKGWGVDSFRAFLAANATSKPATSTQTPPRQNRPAAAVR